MTLENRRPLKARDWRMMQGAAKWLSARSITPNTISIFSIVFAALAAACLYQMGSAAGTASWMLAIASVLFILGRALCNLFDGMVAVEGGKSTPSGELFNDIPDRIADSLILIAAGYASSMPEAGWLAALLAVMTAYIRTLARGIGAPSDFRGPMGKVPRMGVICIAALIAPVAGAGPVFTGALAVIILGCVLTVINRARAAYLYLEGKGHA